LLGASQLKRNSTYYFANTPSKFSPDGFDQEKTIKDIFANLDHP
jgi:hypothetical protein